MQTSRTFLLSLAVVALATLPALSQISFQPGTAVAAGPNPAGVVFADFNGDTLRDMAVTVDGPDRVLIFPGLGNGSFGVPVAVLTGAGTSPHGLDAGDLDGDGDQDLVVSLKNVDSVMFLRNTAGTFAPAGTYPSGGSEPRRVRLGLFDVNGSLDIAVVNRSSDNVGILLNGGTGTFGATATVAAGLDPRDLALGDFNADGRPDVAVTSHDDRTIRILTNNGSGGFAPSASIFVGGLVRPEGVATGDMDGNGSVDVITSTSGTGFNFVTVILNTGGVFGAPANYPSGGVNPSAIEAADLDGDGDLDVAVANEDSASVGLLPNANGILGAAILLATGTTPNALALGDLDGDTDLDLASANRDSANVSVFLNSSQIAPPVQPSLTLVTPAAIGTLATLQLSSPADPGKGYLLAFSFTANAGIPLGNRTFPLDPDILFTMSMTFGNPFFLNFFGGLNAAGQANAYIQVPNEPLLVNASIFGAFIVGDVNAPFGIATISPALQVTFQ